MDVLGVRESGRLETEIWDGRLQQVAADYSERRKTAEIRRNRQRPLLISQPID